MKKITILFYFLLITSAFAQKPNLQKMGLATLEELTMDFYDKDSTASAVILEEKKFIYPSKKKKFNFTKEYYARIKIFDESAFSFATFKIPSYGNSKIDHLEAFTYNLDSDGNIVKSQLDSEDILKEKQSSYTTVNNFTLPNVKAGSVIEYKYTVHRNNYKEHNFYFQGSIPSIKAEYTAFLSGYTNYNVRLIGYLKPDFTESVIKEKCLGSKKCIQIKYLMTDIPAFASEKYMTSKYNYISRLSFEETYKDRFIKNGEDSGWKSLDKWVKETLQNQLNKRSFYKRKLHDSILKETDPLEKAKKTFYYIQNHFVLGNNSGKTFGQSYKNRVASSSRINISLYNALKAVGFKDVQFVMISTRENGLPTKLHATLDDFNSDLIRIVINNKKYFLDATDKLMPFGMLPFQSLNGNGRVFDFDKGRSYWEPIIPIKKNTENVRMNLSMDSQGSITGTKTTSTNGYIALDTRKKIQKLGEEDYLNEIETLNPDIEIEKYEIENLSNLRKGLKETFQITADDVTSLEINSLFLLKKVNPFQLEERIYPVDYGYTQKKTYALSLKAPEGYTFENVPADIILALPNKGGSYLQKVSSKGNSLTIYVKFQINKTIFLSDEYVYLKSFYNKIIKAQNSIIKIKKGA